LFFLFHSSIDASFFVSVLRFSFFVLRSFQWTAADELNAIKTIKEKLETELAEVTQKYTSGTLLSFAFLTHLAPKRGD
jgi:hypothetical protein